MRFFFEVPPIEELQDSSNSPRREEVGRRTLRDYGGFLVTFFYRASFQLFTQHFLVFIEKVGAEVRETSRRLEKVEKVRESQSKLEKVEKVRGSQRK